VGSLSLVHWDGDLSTGNKGGSRGFQVNTEFEE
jgi:hypothetical protein